MPEETQECCHQVESNGRMGFLVQNILERTLAGARRDQETIRSGKPIAKVPDGLTFRDMTAHPDDRGSVTEVYDSAGIGIPIRWTFATSSPFDREL